MVARARIGESALLRLAWLLLFVSIVALGDGHQEGLQDVGPEVVPLPGLVSVDGLSLGAGASEAAGSLPEAVARMVATGHGKSSQMSEAALQDTVSSLVKCFMEATPKCLHPGKAAGSESAAGGDSSEASKQALLEQILTLKQSLQSSGEENKKLQANQLAIEEQAKKMTKDAQEQLDAAKVMEDASKKLAAAPVELEALKLEAVKQQATISDLQATLNETAADKESEKSASTAERQSSEARILMLTSSLERSQVSCRTSLARAQTNAANAMEAISTAEKHAQGLSSQIDELKMERAASEQEIAHLKNGATVDSGDSSAPSHAQNKVKELLAKLNGLHSNTQSPKERSVHEISEKLHTEFSLRQAEKRRTYELTEKLMAGGKLVGPSPGGNNTNDTFAEMARRLQEQVIARTDAESKLHDLNKTLFELRKQHTLSKQAVKDLSKEVSEREMKYKVLHDTSKGVSQKVLNEEMEYAKMKELYLQMNERYLGKENCPPPAPPPPPPAPPPPPPPPPPVVQGVVEQSAAQGNSGAALQQVVDSTSPEGDTSSAVSGQGECNWDCYLERYKDVKDVYGAGNAVGAQNHYENYGRAQGYNCKC